MGYFRFVGRIVLVLLTISGMGIIVLYTSSSFPILLENINITTTMTGNFLSRMGNKDKKELIYGTFDSRIIISNAASLRSPLSIEVDSNVKEIKLGDIKLSNDEIRYNELISWDVNNTLYVHDKDLDLLFKEKFEYSLQ